MSTARFDLTEGAPLSDHDKALLDSVLAAYEIHDHTGGDRLRNPSGSLDAVRSDPGGALPAGVSFFYRFSFLDKFGLETAASTEVVITTPPPLAAPTSPVIETQPGGSLIKGTAYYAISAVDPDGNETRLSDPVVITIMDEATALVTVAGLDFGVDHYNVWRQGARSPGFTKIGTITDPSVVFVDDGSVPDDNCACDPANLPPTFNLTNATSKATLTVPVEDQPLLADGSVTAWRIYRATSSGGYGSKSLLQEIRTTVNPDGTGGLITSFVDDGNIALSNGAPLERSQTLTPSVAIRAGGGSTSLVLGSPTMGGFKVFADVDGNLVTRPSTAPVSTVVLTDVDNVAWRLTVDDMGSLVIESPATATGTDLAFSTAKPLIVPTPDPTYIYAVVVDSGTLATTEA